MYSVPDILNNTSRSNCVIKSLNDVIKPHDDSIEDFIENEMEYDYSFEEYVEENKMVYETPLFDGTSRMRVRTRLPANSFDIWAELSTVCGKGTIISASGTRDHLWLGFMDDRALLRFDVGSGPLELRSGKVRTHGKSKISARRYKRDAILMMNSITVRGSAQGRMSSLDVDPYLYIGHPPDNITKLSETPTTVGFIGCIHRLRISGRDLIPPSKGSSFTFHRVRSCTAHNLAGLVCP